MIGPFEGWSRMVSASMAMAQTGMKMLETSRASNDVIAARSDLINAAFKSPLTADHREWSKMILEKVEAFSQAGASISNIWWGMSSAWMSQAQHMAGLATRGKLLTVSELTALQQRTTAHALSVMDASVDMGTKSLAPIHRTATANAARLSKPAAKKRFRNN